MIFIGVKNLEKKNPNWVNESDSGNTLSYSKVFNASSREYVPIHKTNGRVKSSDLAFHETPGSRKLGYSQTL